MACAYLFDFTAHRRFDGLKASRRVRLKITVPIKYDGKREALELKLTATDGGAKLLIGF